MDRRGRGANFPLDTPTGMLTVSDMAYGKVFESLYTGSMVGAGLSMFALWPYCIANAKPPGTIELNPVILATVFGCTVAEVEEAIEKLCQPDPKSRSKEFEGRRLVKEGEFLYMIPTWPKYNAIRNEIERRAQNREAQKRWRDRKQSKPRVSNGETSKPPSAHGDVDVDREADGTPPSVESTSFDRFYSAYDKKVDRAAAVKAWARLKPTPELVEQIVAAAAAYREATPDKAFRKHPATWLNGKCWENEIVVPSTTAGRRTNLPQTFDENTYKEKSGVVLDENGWPVQEDRP